MNFAQAFKKILKSRNKTQSSLAEETHTAQGSIASMLYKGNPSFKAADRYLDACGYKIVLVPEGTTLPDDWYVVDDFEGTRKK